MNKIDLMRENKRLRSQLKKIKAELARITSDRDAKTKRMWQLAHELDCLKTGEHDQW